jgi:hypothetical protein
MCLSIHPLHYFIYKMRESYFMLLDSLSGRINISDVPGRQLCSILHAKFNGSIVSLLSETEDFRVIRS